MSQNYFKRFRMELDLRRRPPELVLPPGYRLIAWTPQRLEDHAETKFESFRGEIDSCVFDCLSEYEGCLRLMEEIVHKPGFLPEATWLVESRGAGGESQTCGAIQGVRSTPRYGAIQNVGVTAEHRGRGIGRALVAAALLGFHQAGLRRAFLEVTADNSAAVNLYQSVGFRRVKTIYKAVDFAYS